MVFKQNHIEELIEGYWHNIPKEDWQVNNVVASYKQACEDYQKHKESLLIVIDKETIDKHIEGLSNWEDNREIALKASPYISGIITETPFLQLDESIPQFIVDDAYKALDVLAHSLYDSTNATLIMTAGSRKQNILTVNSLLEELLSKNNKEIIIKKYDNINISLLTAMASVSEKTNYVITEASIPTILNKQIYEKYIPDISIISSIEAIETKNIDTIIDGYTNLITNMFKDGTVILNSDSDGFEKLYKNIDSLKLNYFTYGLTPNSNAFVVGNKPNGEFEQIEASILGEYTEFQMKINDIEDVRCILSVLLVLKVLGISFYLIERYLKGFISLAESQHIEHYKTKNGDTYGILINNTLSTMKGITESINELAIQSKHTKGRTLLIMGDIANLREGNKEGYKNLAETILNANIDLVLGYGNNISKCLEYLPETKILGKYNSIKHLAQETAAIIENEDTLLITGDGNSEEWSLLQDLIIKYATDSVLPSETKTILRFSDDDYGVATFNMRTGEKVAQYGNQFVTQNAGAGNLILLHHILSLIFVKKLNPIQIYKPDKQSIDMSNINGSISLTQEDDIKLNDLLSVAIVTGAPNAFTMLANSVLGSYENSLSMVKNMVNALGLNNSIAENITGKAINDKRQKLTLGNLFVIGKLLFTNYPEVRDMLSLSYYTFKDVYYKTKSNLYDYGIITHGLFYGANDSIGVVRSKFNGETYITVSIGAKNAFHRDAMIYQSIAQVMGLNSKKTKLENIRKLKQSPYKINILGEIYFGESFVNRTNDESLREFLMNKKPSYSFNEIRPLLEVGDFNICMLDAPTFNVENTYLQQRIPNIRRSNETETLEVLKEENIDLVTLASPHNMDSEEEGLNQTLNLLDAHDIYKIGAGKKQKTAEKPFTIFVNKQRYMIYNACYYEPDSYYLYNRYAIGEERGIACLNPFIYQQINSAKQKDETTKIIVIANWKYLFDKSEELQHKYVECLSNAGADIIIGHGSHNMKGIEKINSTIVLYDVGTGVFISDEDTRKSFQAPYSLIPQINVNTNHTISLKLYPIYTNNHKTQWQPRFVEEEEFNHCYTLLKRYGTLPEITMKKDNYYYFEISL